MGRVPGTRKKPYVNPQEQISHVHPTDSKPSVNPTYMKPKVLALNTTKHKSVRAWGFGFGFRV